MKRLFFFITFIILVVAIDSVAQQAERRARAITGRVISDSGQPIANATVRFNKVGARPGPGVFPLGHVRDPEPPHGGQRDPVAARLGDAASHR